MLRWYSGAIFTAVCCRLVVAPPMSSGRWMSRRAISLATNTISSSDGVMRPLSPIRSAFSSSAGEVSIPALAASWPGEPDRLGEVPTVGQHTEQVRREFGA